ncbi:MAG: helix-turn-helix domain-containing protein [Kineosporiaceae bacterium]|jgi:excisionase family DNA binding protein
MTTTTPRPLLATLDQAATALAVSVDTIRELIAQGELTPLRLRGSGRQRFMVRVRWDDIHAYANTGADT